MMIFRSVLVGSMLLLSCNIFAQSFVYDGFECEGSQSPSTILKQSRFEVIEDLGDGAYRLKFTGGLPLFSHNSGPCVGAGSAFGVETSEVSVGKLVEKNDGQALAYFTGTHLIISFSSFASFNEGSVLGGTLVISSYISPQNFTWIFEFIPQSMSFKLIRNMDISGMVSSTGSVLPFPGEVHDFVSLFTSHTATPGKGIEYRLEQ